jgi:hypothetical protein
MSKYYSSIKVSEYITTDIRLSSDELLIKDDLTTFLSINETNTLITNNQDLKIDSPGMVSNDTAVNVDGGATVSQDAVVQDMDVLGNIKSAVLSEGVRYVFNIVPDISYTLLSTDYAVEFSNTLAVSVSLPPASNKGQTFLLISTGATGAVTINRAGADVIDAGATSIVLSSQYDRVRLMSNGVDKWYSL